VPELRKEWLKERFCKVKNRFGTIEFLVEEIEKTLREGLQQVAVDVAVARFPKLENLAKVIIDTVSDPNQLHTLIVELSTASSQEHAKQLLLSVA
jgi:uncharacterized protein (UPF0212 family)